MRTLIVLGLLCLLQSAAQAEEKRSVVSVRERQIPIYDVKQPKISVTAYEVRQQKNQSKKIQAQGKKSLLVAQN